MIIEGPGAWRIDRKPSRSRWARKSAYDDEGNVVTGSFMDFFMPTAVENRHWETDFTVTPFAHHPIGAKGVGESPNVGGGAGVFQRRSTTPSRSSVSTHIQMPHDYWRNWRAAKSLGVFGNANSSCPGLSRASTS